MQHKTKANFPINFSLHFYSTSFSLPITSRFAKIYGKAAFFKSHKPALNISYLYLKTIIDYIDLRLQLYLPNYSLQVLLEIERFEVDL